MNNPQFQLDRPSAAAFQARRKTFLDTHPDSALVVFGGGQDARYLTGFGTGEFALVLGRDRSGASVETAYIREPTARDLAWNGPQVDSAQLRSGAGLRRVEPWGRLWEQLPEALVGACRVGFAAHELVSNAARLVPALAAAMRAAKRDVVAEIVCPSSLLREARWIKDDREVSALRAAAAVTVEAHRRVRAGATPGISAVALAARFDAAVREVGAESGEQVNPGYRSIVAGGSEAVVLHARPSARAIDQGETILVDSGAAVQGYTVDVSRTWPLAAARSAAQQRLFDGVLAALRSAVAEVRPGARLGAVHDAARFALERTQRALGLPGALDRWFPHGVGHWVGLDVHDVGHHGPDVILRTGMVLTVEPGLYVPADADDAPDGLRGEAIRLEDTVVVTDDGHENLTEPLSHE